MAATTTRKPAQKPTRITLAGAASILGVSESRVRQLRAEGVLAGYKTGSRRLVFDEAEVRALKARRDAVEPAPVHWRSVKAG